LLLHLLLLHHHHHRHQLHSLANSCSSAAGSPVHDRFKSGNRKLCSQRNFCSLIPISSLPLANDKCTVLYQPARRGEALVPRAPLTCLCPHLALGCYFSRFSRRHHQSRC
jgi:hypothetical protein